MKLTINAIIKWEQLNRRPFSTMNYTDEGDIVSLFYVCSLSEESGTLAEFREDLTDESLKEMIVKFEKHTRFAAQFQIVAKKQDSDNSDPVYVKDIAGMLIMDGLDVHYVLNEMQLYELSIFLHAYEQKTRRQQESARLWAFIQVSPYLSKKIKTPRDLCPFEWEKESKIERTKEQEENDLSIFEAFMKSGKKIS